MKIAVLTSGAGDKAIYIHEFFKEGNRVSIDAVVTDNPYAPAVETARREGLEVIELLPGQSWLELAERLRERGAELLVVDDFSGELPQELRDAFGEAIVFPSEREKAPLEVIETVDAINARRYAVPEDRAQAPESASPAAEQEPSDLEKEWAEALNIEPSSSAEGPATPPEPNPGEAQGQQPLQQPPFPGQQPQPPFGAPMGQPYGQPSDPRARMAQNAEPMPETYLVWSVVITILCCLIPGIIAIIYSASVSSKYYQGNIEGARRASRNAQIWCIVSIIAGIVWATLYIPLALFLS